MIKDKSTTQKEDARDIILNSAIEEFSEKGYDKASTNTIASMAGVSKGLIFHYFKSKMGLFLECIEQVMAYYYKNVLTPEYFAHTDVFERMIFAAETKKSVIKKEMKVYNFIIKVYTLPKTKEFEKVHELIGKYLTNAVKYFADGLDTSQIKDGLDKERTMMYIFKMMQLYSASIINKNDKNNEITLYDEFDNIIDEFKEIVEFMKYGVYKSGE